MDIRLVRERVKQGELIYNIPLNVTYYARVSTEKEEQQSSLENQIDYYTSYIKEKPEWNYIPGYIDEGISAGTTKKRDRFMQMIEDARKGLFDLIVTKEISRFSRNTLESITYTRDLLDMGVCVMFQNDGINTLDTDSEFRLVIMAGVAQDEIRKLSERLKFGFRQSIKNGRVLGNNRMYGYNKSDCKMEIDEEQAAVIRVIFDLYANHNLGIRKISQHIYENYGATSYNGNQFNIKTVQNIIRNPKYKGYYCANKTRSLDYRTHKNEPLDQSEWVIYKDASVPAIVSEDLWDKANKIMDGRSATAHNYDVTYHNRYPYSGKIICAEHNTSFHRSILKSKQGEKEQWHCKVYKNHGKAACNAPKIRTTELDAILAEVFTTMKYNKKSLIDKTIALIQGTPDSKNYDRELVAADKELDNIMKKKDKLLDMSIEELISKAEFKERNDKLNVQAESLKARIEMLESEKSKSEYAVENLEKIRISLEKQLNFDNGINSELVASILEKVVVYTTGDETLLKLDIHLKIGEIITGEYDRKLLSQCSNALRSTTPRQAIRTILSLSAPSV